MLCFPTSCPTKPLNMTTSLKVLDQRGLARPGSKPLPCRHISFTRSCKRRGTRFLWCSHQQQTEQHGPDISRLKPELQQQWHRQKNASFGSATINPFSFCSAIWICPHCQHEWQSRILDRALGSTGCPRCSRLETLQTMCNDPSFPFKAQWNHLRNARDGILPEKTQAGSRQPIWWQCTSCPQKWPHEWQASPVSRSKQAACPFCSNVKPCICNSVSRP